MRIDVTDAAGVEAGLKQIVDAEGGIDVVVNNAGVTIVGSRHRHVRGRLGQRTRVNLKSVYLVSRAAWPHLEPAAAARS